MRRVGLTVFERSRVRRQVKLLETLPRPAVAQKLEVAVDPVECWIGETGRR